MFLSFSVCVLLAQLASALLPTHRGVHFPRASMPKASLSSSPKVAPVVSRNGTKLPPYSTVYEFNQLIDHNNPSLGTFKQRFWHTYEFYEPGGPIVLLAPPESNGEYYTEYLTNQTMTGMIAQQQNGSVVVLEHRFFGLSNPRPDLTVKSLQLLTVQQAIDDIAYFSQNVQLPMPGAAMLTSNLNPWVLVGGSYSGALVSYTMVNKPGVFWAGYASSAPVEAIANYWNYFEPIRLNMPQNCSADAQAVLSHVDDILAGTNASAIQSIKSTFGLGGLSHLDDFGIALRSHFIYWQQLDVYTQGGGAPFYKFCDALEVKKNQNAPASGWGLNYALKAWGSYWTTTYYKQQCGKLNAEDCWGSYDANQTWYTDTSVNNDDRSWTWLTCNELGFFQDSAPQGNPSLVLRVLTPAYDLRTCNLMFPGAFSSGGNPKADSINQLYQGWNVKQNRLFFANGLRDPWREATVSSDSVSVPSTDSQPIAVSDGFHCSDLMAAAAVDKTVYAVQQKALQYMAVWLAAWKKPV